MLHYGILLGENGDEKADPGIYASVVEVIAVRKAQTKAKRWR
jgi:hypothetical protein